ncbi:kinesin-like protein Klp5 [Gryganskiella cystojenkinii]|nr:kinesin-like protein Klp5 [Gryganskiella cystojenkinii]
MSSSHEATPWPAESAILVAVRVRPFSPSEAARLPQEQTNKMTMATEASLSYSEDTQNNNSNKMAITTQIRKVVDALDDRVLIFDPPDPDCVSKIQKSQLPVQGYRKFKDMRFAFDRVFNQHAQQQEVFESTTKHLIDGVLEGYNGTLFAYGATGCGKTHTISGTTEKPGIIFLTMQELFERVKELEDEKIIEISVSYLEVYNETIRDLLVVPTATKSESLHLREDSTKKVFIPGLTEHHPKGIDELMDLVFKGNGHRTVSPTEANAVSSRSHAVLQINVCQKLKTANVSDDFTIATLSLIDLAGSERASVTKNLGKRLVEGANINRSLLALGNCINALCDIKTKGHVPYRDSKLTRLLKFSLGGNCKTVMIACVSPSSQHYEETQNTLKYANRAKNIKTKVSKNTLNVDLHVSQYVQVIYELRQEVAKLKNRLKNGDGTTTTAIKAATGQSSNFFNSMRYQDTAAQKYRAFIPELPRGAPAILVHVREQMIVAIEQLKALEHWRELFTGELPDSAGMKDLNLGLTGMTAEEGGVSLFDRIFEDVSEWLENMQRQVQEFGQAMPTRTLNLRAAGLGNSMLNPVTRNGTRSSLPGSAMTSSTATKSFLKRRSSLSYLPHPLKKTLISSPRKPSNTPVVRPAIPATQKSDASASTRPPWNSPKGSSPKNSPRKVNSSAYAVVFARRRGGLKQPRDPSSVKRKVTFSSEAMAKDADDDIDMVEVIESSSIKKSSSFTNRSSSSLPVPDSRSTLFSSTSTAQPVINRRRSLSGGGPMRGVANSTGGSGASGQKSIRWEPLGRTAQPQQQQQQQPSRLPTRSASYSPPATVRSSPQKTPAVQPQRPTTTTSQSVPSTSRMQPLPSSRRLSMGPIASSNRMSFGFTSGPMRGVEAAGDGNNKRPIRWETMQNNTKKNNESAVMLPHPALQVLAVPQQVPQFPTDDFLSLPLPQTPPPFDLPTLEEVEEYLSPRKHAREENEGEEGTHEGKRADDSPNPKRAKEMMMIESGEGSPQQSQQQLQQEVGQPMSFEEPSNLVEILVHGE